MPAMSDTPCIVGSCHAGVEEDAEDSVDPGDGRKGVMATLFGSLRSTTVAVDGISTRDRPHDLEAENAGEGREGRESNCGVPRVHIPTKATLCQK